MAQMSPAWVANGSAQAVHVLAGIADLLHPQARDVLWLAWMKQPLGDLLVLTEVHTMLRCRNGPRLAPTIRARGGRQRGDRIPSARAQDGGGGGGVFEVAVVGEGRDGVFDVAVATLLGI
ncbi:hypothetical protein ACP70R_032827 [Stipagrostis hirtigluma subsp. patula]